MFEFEVAPGAKVPIAHSHDAYEETAYGLEGILFYTVNGLTMEGARATPSSSLAESSTASKTSTPPRQKPRHHPPPTSSAADYFREIAAVLQSTPPGTTQPRHQLRNYAAPWPIPCPLTNFFVQGGGSLLNYN